MPDSHAIDLSDGASFASGFPHAFFTTLRDEAPVYWHAPTPITPDGEGFWVVSRYDDVAYVQRHPALFSSETGQGARAAGGTGLKDERTAGTLLNQTDDPRHKRLRALVSQAFTPKAIGRLRSELERRIGELFDAVPNLEHFDFVHAVARELPLQTICAVLGVPQEDRAMLIELVDGGVSTGGASIINPEHSRRIFAYAAQIIERKRAAPGEDILSGLVNARLDDGSGLSDRELSAFFALLFPAGAETTRSALAGAVLAFCEAPAQYDALRANPGLMRSAVEEIVRWTTPSIYKRRTATQDTRLAGTRIRRGEKVTFWEMSANRDARAFEDPFSFDVARWPNKHLGFGAGVHFCLGASLARTEIEVVLREMLRRFAGFSRSGECAWMPSNRLLGLTRLEVAAHPAN